MVRFTHAAAGLSLASAALASPLQGQLYGRQYNASTPCAQVSASVAAQKPAATPTVAAELAYECITSVPFNQTAALALVDGVVPYFKWQSNTAFLKDPPAEYAEKVQPPIVIWGGLEKIRGKVVGGEYKNEYEVSNPSALPVRSSINQASSASSFTLSSSRRTMDISSIFLTLLVQSSTSPDLFLLSRCWPTERSFQSLMSTQTCSPNRLAMQLLLLLQSARLMAKKHRLSWRTGRNGGLFKTAMRCITMSSTIWPPCPLVLLDLASGPSPVVDVVAGCTLEPPLSLSLRTAPV